MSQQELDDISTIKLPEALKQLQSGFESMDKIAQYCHSQQKKKEYQQIYIQSQNYSKDALTNAAYHVHAVGIHLTQFLQLQAERVEQLEIHIKILSDRLSGLKSAAGLAGYASSDAEVLTPSGAKNELIPGAYLPVSSRISARYLRKPITEDIYLEKPMYNPYQCDTVPPPFEKPLSVEEFQTWISGGTDKGGVPISSSPVPGLDTSGASNGSGKTKDKKKRDKTEKAQNSGRKKRKEKKESASEVDGITPPTGTAPPPPI